MAEGPQARPGRGEGAGTWVPGIFEGRARGEVSTPHQLRGPHLAVDDTAAPHLAPGLR